MERSALEKNRDVIMITTRAKMTGRLHSFCNFLIIFLRDGGREAGS